MHEFVGHGLVIPFHRGARDFATADGERLVRACVQQILGTVGASDFTQGELPWRTEFGSLLHLLRHQQNDVALREMAKVYVRDALQRWEPRVRVTQLDAQRADDAAGGKLILRLRYDVVQRNVPGGQMLFAGLEQTVAVTP
ncbi:GPW/gp25 family protein [Haliangium sp.]|uniref:GPW/gp25 family protein n=1 Tax=Haliangium sp. TaxID=2663208 RepID=UPI003D0F634F